MANNSKSKLKLLYLKRILEEETDEGHGLSMTQLIDRLHALRDTGGAQGRLPRP